jgi:hypothetical protein
MQELDGVIALLQYLSNQVAMSDVQPASNDPDAADIVVDAVLEKLLAISAAHGGAPHA